MTRVVRARQSGFTLVELIVAIGIIAILATLLLGVAAVAAGSAREARTSSLVARLHTLLIERYDQYRSRRVEVASFRDTVAHRAALAAEGGFSFPADLRPALDEANGTGDPRVTAMTRLAALRELVKIEMPDRWTDVLLADVGLAPNEPTFLSTSPAVRNAYLRAYNNLVGRTNTVTGAVNSTGDIVANQGAELLYLTIIHTTGDGEARGLFKEADLGDTDGDGAPEFIDGWGQPITYLRWAPGFDSSQQLDTDELLSLSEEEIRERIREDHDPYDLFRVDNPSADDTDLLGSANYAGLRGWRLTPLILSAGPDEELGLLLDNDANNLRVLANPYGVLSGGGWLGGYDAGEPDAYADNVHNHDTGSLSRTR